MLGKNGYGPTRTGLFLESGFGTASAGAGEDDRLNFGKGLKGGGQPAWFGAGRRKTEMGWRMKALLRKESWRTRPAVTPEPRLAKLFGRPPLRYALASHP